MKNLGYLFTIIVVSGLFINPIHSQNNFKNEIYLWPEGAPGSKNLEIKEQIIDRSKAKSKKDRSVKGITKPSIIPFLPENNSKTNPAVLICPGGGYERVVIDKGGFDIANWLNSIGVAAFVLKYRLPGEGHKKRYNVPLQDAQRAMKLIRHNKNKWKINPDELGIIGFSAGGHLAATLGNNVSETVYDPVDSIDTLSSKPNFLMLVYPVISMKDNITHAGTKKRLLGHNPSDKLIQKYSNEININENLPPAFIVHAGNDPVSPLNSIRFTEAIKEKGKEVELHIFAQGGHGFGIRHAEGPIRLWTKLAEKWLVEYNYIPN